MQQVFQSAYRNNVWGDPESVSGPGSGLRRTEAFRDQIPPLLEELGARSLIDAGCGDFNWMKEIQLPVDWYLGVEIVPELAARNRDAHSDPTRTFMHADLARDDLPRADVILCRDCLVHFSFEDIQAALRNFKRSQSLYLLTTTFIEFQTNLDMETGGWRRLNLERAPFHFPPPLKAIDEKCLHTGGIYADKRLALWRLVDIAA
jgi:SAM-dependent methyltransferase